MTNSVISVPAVDFETAQQRAEALGGAIGVAAEGGWQVIVASVSGQDPLVGRGDTPDEAVNEAVILVAMDRALVELRKKKHERREEQSVFM